MQSVSQYVCAAHSLCVVGRPSIACLGLNVSLPASEWVLLNDIHKPACCHFVIRSLAPTHFHSLSGSSSGAKQTKKRSLSLFQCLVCAMPARSFCPARAGLWEQKGGEERPVASLASSCIHTSMAHCGGVVWRGVVWYIWFFSFPSRSNMLLFSLSLLACLSACLPATRAGGCPARLVRLARLCTSIKSLFNNNAHTHCNLPTKGVATRKRHKPANREGMAWRCFLACVYFGGVIVVLCGL